MVPLYKYQLFGTLFGLALHNGVTLPVSFPFALYRKLLSQPCDELDLLEGWPDLAKSLEYLRNYDGSVEDDLMRDYVFTFVANGLHVETSMEDPWGESSSPRGTVPMQTNTPGMLKILGIYPDKHHPQTSPTPEARNGASTLRNSDAASTSDGAASYLSTDPQTFNWPGWITDVASDTPVPVTNSNREEYVRDYTQWVLDYSVRPQFQAFAQGCHNVMDPKALSVCIFRDGILHTAANTHGLVAPNTRSITHNHRRVQTPRRESSTTSSHVSGLRTKFTSHSMVLGSRP